MVELEIRKFGDSLGVVLPKEVLNRLQTGDGKRILLIEAADRDYWVTPEHPAFEKKFREGKEIMARYPNTLHALAK